MAWMSSPVRRRVKALHGRKSYASTLLASAALTLGSPELLSQTPISGEAWVRDGLAITRTYLETQTIGGGYENHTSIAVSPDGEVAYTQVDLNVEKNTVTNSLLLTSPKARSHSKQIETSSQPQGLSTNFQPKFSPSGAELGYLFEGRLIIKSLEGDKRQEIVPGSMPADLFGAEFAPTGIGSFSWSPDGDHIALLVIGRGTKEILAGVALSMDDRWPPDPMAAPSRLATYDRKSGRWASLAPNNIDVDSFDWAPDGRKIAYMGSVDDVSAWARMHNRLFITDLAGRTTKSVPLPAGANRNPFWSPDGHWIAFESQNGQVRYLSDTRVGLYDVNNEALSYPGFDELGAMSGYRARIQSWSPDGKALLLEVPYHLSNQLFSLSIPDGRLRRFSQGDNNDFYGAHYSTGAKTLTFLSQSFLQAPNVYISPAGRFEPRQLTHATLSVDTEGFEQRLVSWPSKDGKWTVHGWLLLPRGRQPKEPLPLLVYAEGGPNMTMPWLHSAFWQFPLQAFVANGVAVFIPNSRGREGYGIEFQRAWETEHDCAEGPLSDVLEGVAQLVKSGIVDTDRVAIAGLSWGGYLAAYALTHTSRFKAVIVDEAVSLNMMDHSFGLTTARDWVEFAHQLGESTAFEPGGAEHLRRLSPIYEVANATTPALLKFGANSAIQDGIELFQGLRHFNVPAELISYPRTGHGKEEPALLYDAAERDFEWFSYWVLGKPTQRMFDRYGAPQISKWIPASEPSN
jgi:dipeptidyl aminopeptidase/acylaminoacyl peptidase